MATITLQPRPAHAEERYDGFWGVVMIAGACVLVAALGVLIATPAADAWYASLPKPSWTPPDWIFGAVWTALSGTMAVAALLVWAERERTEVCDALTAFGVQLLVNLFWQVCFFGLRRPLLAFLDLAFLWVLVGLATVEFFRVSRPAGWLMVPTFLWVTFAGVINAAILLYVA